MQVASCVVVNWKFYLNPKTFISFIITIPSHFQQQAASKTSHVSLKKNIVSCTEMALKCSWGEAHFPPLHFFSSLKSITDYISSLLCYA